MSDFDTLLQQKRSSLGTGRSSVEQYLEVFKYRYSKDRLLNSFANQDKVEIDCGMYMKYLPYTEKLKFKIEVDTYIYRLSKNIKIEWGRIILRNNIPNPNTLILTYEK